MTYAGAISGGGSVIMAGCGTIILTGNNTGFTGTTTVAAGILDAASPGAFPGTIAASGVESGATLAVGVSGLTQSQASTEIAALSSSGDFAPGANLGIDAGIGTFEYNNSNYAAISDPGPDCPVGLVVLGSGGTLNLDGSSGNTYSGGTIIVGATVELGGATDLGATGGSLTVDGGTLNLEDNSPVLGAVTVSDTGNVTNGSMTATSCA